MSEHYDDHDEDLDNRVLRARAIRAKLRDYGLRQRVPDPDFEVHAWDEKVTITFNAFEKLLEKVTTED